MPQPPPVEKPRKRRRSATGLALGLVVLSPLCAESLSGYDSTTGDPLALLGGLLFLGPLYGCPALLIRELARRRRLGWPGIVTLAAGFGVLQAGVIDQSMFALSYRAIPYWDDLVRPTLIEPLGTAPYLVLVFVTGHIVYSFCAPIALVESLGGPEAHRPWLRARGLTIAVSLYLAAAFLVWHDHLSITDDHASLPQAGTALATAVLLFAAALAWGRRDGTAQRAHPIPPAKAVGALSMVAALVFNLLPSTWPGVAAGTSLLALAAAAVAAASRSARWTRRHVVAVAGGAVLAMALTAFFVTPLGDVPAVRQYAHNTVFLLGSLVLIGWAARRADRLNHAAQEK